MEILYRENPESNYTILVSNDDGVEAMGIDIIARSMLEYGSLRVITSKNQQTAMGKSLEFNKPVRIDKDKTQSGIPALAHNTTPAASVMIHKHFFNNPDIIVSGINAGENTSIHSILTSGTAGVALEGGLHDIPSFAFSIDVPEQYFYSNEIPGPIKLAAEKSKEIVKVFMDHASEEFWRKILFINVNYPDNLRPDSEILISEMDTYKYDNYLYEKKDPKGENYYWLWGNKREDLDPSKDTYQLMEEKKITITPVVFDKMCLSMKDVQETTKKIVDLLNGSSD